MKRIKKGAAIIGVVAVAAVYFGYGHFLQELKKAERVRCKARLNQIGLSIRLYGDENNQAHPSTFGAVVKSVPSMEAVNFVCPVSGTGEGPMETVDDWTDFVLLTNRIDLASERKITCYCRPSNHDGDGCGVLYSDGTVDWIAKEELDRHLNSEPRTPAR